MKTDRLIPYMREFKPPDKSKEPQTLEQFLDQIFIQEALFGSSNPSMHDFVNTTLDWITTTAYPNTLFIWQNQIDGTYSPVALHNSEDKNLSTIN
jgi:hypothetical protein